MSEIRRDQKKKTNLHPRSKHRDSYDFITLIESHPTLSSFVFKNKYDNESIDFFNTEAVRALNTALLKKYYNLNYWEIPEKYLCPPVPGRADYIHQLADLLASKNKNKKIPRGEKIKCLDIGVGANLIYPIIGLAEYGWSFIGSDIDMVSIDAANGIIERNTNLKERINIRLQSNVKNIFRGILQEGELIDITICNPPFHASASEARKANQRKVNNLTKQKDAKGRRNFGGTSKELWYEGGELAFITRMIAESVEYDKSCFWFTTLVSKEANLDEIYYLLEKAEAKETRTLAMSQGNKKSRIVAWTFLTPKQQNSWIEARWA